ncbi:MAG TPA: malto-oligosyltrehalose synthase [Terriglobia bacterium]|nr:malto-oligosyltrehalose synthase [Terriglobia bacterium]
MRIPVSTYRLQFNRDFRFVDAIRIVDYLHDLGITDLYASPILKARPGSTHGYDVVDPTQINPEIGTVEEFNQLVEALQAKSMGFILDIVPNHMAASVDNPWWFDVLEKGQDSPYAAFFDVNWASKKVLLPVLGRPYGEALENKELVLKLENGRQVLQYHELKLPIAAGGEDMNVDQILSRQHYRLAFWRKAADGINYRRFFDITDLIGLRTERDEVFEATHKYIFTFVEEGKVTGLRIDHIDGLLDPKAYLDRLPEVYVVTEKILAGNELLPGDWRTHGTTGYDFLNFVNGAFIDREGFHTLEKIYSELTLSTEAFTGVFRERKRQVMRELFAGEMAALLHRLYELAEEDRHARDLATEELKEAFVSVTACLPVYRTYVRDERISQTGRAYIEDSIAVAGKGPAFDFLRRVLLVDPAWYLQHRKPDYLDFVMRWQQFTGPVMAKGLEDTTFYVHNPLVSVNEVGGESNGPELYFGVEEFHRRNKDRRNSWPQTMNATSTHDTKRSEDVRTRIDVLSEMPEEWSLRLHRWIRFVHADDGPAPNEQVLIFQSMLGAWPIEADRLKQYVTKALREGKTHTSWIDVDEAYENRALSFVDSLYANEAFLKDFAQFQTTIAYYGALSSLSQLVLKIASPGVPDFYRGTDAWDFSLADPDNRRPVDFSSRMEMLEQLKKHANPRELLKSWADGRLKLYVTWKLLNFRRQHSELFLHGEYIPLRIAGPRANHLIAFARRLHDDWCVIAVPRLLAKLGRGNNLWQNTSIELPPEAPVDWNNILTSEDVSSPLFASALFATLPLAVLSPRK